MDTNRVDAGRRLGTASRTSPGMLLRVAGCSRYTTQLLSQPHTALLTQISTHAVHRPWPERARASSAEIIATWPYAPAVAWLERQLTTWSTVDHPNPKN